MELQYVKAMTENNLNVSDLPEDAQTGIAEIKKVLHAIGMVEKKGKKPQAPTLKKLKAMDKWVYYEILDHLHGTDKNDDDLPHDSDEVIDDLETSGSKEKGSQDEGSNSKVQGDGKAIEDELAGLYGSGKHEWTIAQIKSDAPATYNVLFQAYKKGEENGVETTSYSLIETGNNNYKLNKK